MSFMTLKRFKTAKSLLRKTMPVARRVLGESHDLTLRMRWSYAALYEDNGAGSTISGEAARRSKTRHGPRDACSAARTRSQGLSKKMRELAPGARGGAPMTTVDAAAARKVRQ